MWYWEVKSQNIPNHNISLNYFHTFINLSLSVFTKLTIIYLLFSHIYVECCVICCRNVAEFICKIKVWLVYVTLTISAWILVAFTIERFLSVFFPHKLKTFCGRGSSIIAVICIVVTTFAYCSHFLYGFGNVKVDFGNGSVHDYCMPIPNDYFYFYVNVHPWLDFCLNCFIPLIIFVVCNSCIAVRVLLRWRNMQKIADSKATKHANRESSAATDRNDNDSRLTIMLFTVTVVFLLTTAPVRVLIILSEWLYEQNFTRKQYALIHLVFRVSNILMYFNNSVNFFLYCVTGSKFRKELQKMLRKLRERIFKKHPSCDGENEASRRPSLDARQTVFTEVFELHVTELQVTELPNEAIELIQLHDHQDKS